MFAESGMYIIGIVAILIVLIYYLIFRFSKSYRKGAANKQKIGWKKSFFTDDFNRVFYSFNYREEAEYDDEG
ncbi:MAG: hypothetical protein WCO55_02745 [Candidatus Falkowbacteria bacterium]